jgi:hypothetical protein
MADGFKPLISPKKERCYRRSLSRERGVQNIYLKQEFDNLWRSM